MRVLVFGNGWIGNLIKQRLPLHPAPEIIEVRVSSSNILDIEAVEKELYDFMPHTVINTAGHCGNPNIDACETDENAKRITMDSNGYAPRVLYDTFMEYKRNGGIYCRQMDDPWFKFIHLSSGCLWNRPGDLVGIHEGEKPEVNSWYSHTKVMGEDRLKSTSAIILRIRMPIDWQPHSRNLINKLSNYKMVIDTPNSVTTIDYLMQCVKLFAHNRNHSDSGIWNVCNGVLSAEDIMRCYKEYVNQNVDFSVITANDLSKLGLVKTGRSNCILSTEKIDRYVGRNSMSSQEMIRDIMIKYKQELDRVK